MFQHITDWLFDPSGLTPHGFCLLWSPSLIWLHAVSDVAIGLSYFSIPITLAAVIRHRPDLVFRPLLVLSAAFILLCGIGHLLEVVTLWIPAYGIQGIEKATTALVSIVTAVSLAGLMPQMLALPSPAQLRKANHDLLTVREAESRMTLIAQDASAARDALERELARREVAEKKMQDSEERFQLLLQSNVADALYLLDADGNIETWNVAAERIKGYTPEEIIGRNFAVFFTPEDLALGMPARLLARARDTGRFSIEGWRLRKDGVRFLARVSIDAIRRPNGTLRGFVKVTQDITDRQVEEEQRAIIIEAAPNGMIIVGENGIITLANRQATRIFDYPDGALVGQPVHVLMTQEQSDAYGQFVAGLGTNTRSPQQAFVARKRDGTPVTVELMINAVKTPRGHILVASLFDVSERVRAAAEREEAERRERQAAEATNAELDRLSRHLAEALDRAEQASQAKSRFLAGVTHELRTPLHGLLGYAELLMLEGGLSPAQTERLETMMASGQHLLGMVNAVLDMSQIEADRLEMQPAEVDLPELVGVCMNVIRPAARARGLDLNRAPSEAFRVTADPTRLRQVLINLLGNAVKFTPSGRVDVRLLSIAGGAFVRVEVADTGPGVRPQHRTKLFNTFERLNAEAVSGIEGTGLGLAISAKLTALMGGRIGYDDNPGGGSIFWLELPACQAASAEAVPVLPDAAPAEVRKLRILVADDEALNRSIAGSFLGRAGHDFVCVENGLAAVEAAAAADFDVILMDVRMPGLNGMEATRRIRALPGARGRVRIIAVTAQAFAEQIAQCRQAGMDGHLSKPFKFAMLCAALQNEGTEAASERSVAAPAAAIFDRDMFLDAVEFMSPEEVAEHVHTLIERCEAMLARLHGPGALDSPALLVEDAHKLAGTSSMFGLMAAGETARALEHAAGRAENVAQLVTRLEAALELSIGVLRGELHVAAAG
jgi:PAS domain S-box-containing protein